MADDAAAAAVVLPDPVVVHADMPEDAKKMCFEAAKEALTKHKVEKDQAMHVKKALEAWNGGLWHCIIGTGFGASVAHDNHGLLLFRIGKVHILCFQSFDEGSLINTKKEATHVPRAVQQKKADEDAEEGGEGAA